MRKSGIQNATKATGAWWRAYDMYQSLLRPRARHGGATRLTTKTDLRRRLPQKTALVSSSQLVGGTIGIAIASSVFGTKLSSALREFAPDAPYALVRNSVQAIPELPEDLQPGVVHAYVLALRNVFIIAVPAGGLTSLSALMIRNLSVKGKKLSAGAA